ncbi:MAG: AI-2E family transporter [Chloroflexota bacterium]
MQTHWSKTTKYLVGIAVVALAIYTIYLSSSVIPLLIIAGLMAVLVRPPIAWLHHKLHLPLGLAVTLVHLLLVVIVPVIVALLVPAIIDASRYILDLDYDSIIQRITNWSLTTLTAIKAFQMPSKDLDRIVDRSVDDLILGLQNATPTFEVPPVSTIIQSLTSALSTTFGAATGLIGDVFSTIILIIFIVLASIYFSLSAHTYRSRFIEAVPVAYQSEMGTLLDRIGITWNSFFRGQLSLMVIIGVMSWVGLTILGVPGALGLAIVAGVLEIIPNLGPVIATIPAVIVALIQGSTYLPISPAWLAIIVALFYLLVQQLENSVIVPRVLGDAVGLPPLIVMTGVLVGTIVAGILGALLATPVIATAYEILRYVYAKMMDQEPFQTPLNKRAAGPPTTPLPQRVRRWVRARTQRQLPSSDTSGNESTK